MNDCKLVFLNTPTAMTVQCKMMFRDANIVRERVSLPQLVSPKRYKLHAHEPGMALVLDHFRQQPVGRHAGKTHEASVRKLGPRTFVTQSDDAARIKLAAFVTN